MYVWKVFSRLTLTKKQPPQDSGTSAPLRHHTLILASFPVLQNNLESYLSGHIVPLTFIGLNHAFIGDFIFKKSQGAKSLWWWCVGGVLKSRKRCEEWTVEIFKMAKYSTNNPWNHLTVTVNRRFFGLPSACVSLSTDSGPTLKSRYQIFICFVH